MTDQISYALTDLSSFKERLPVLLGLIVLLGSIGPMVYLATQVDVRFWLLWFAYGALAAVLMSLKLRPDEPNVDLGFAVFLTACGSIALMLAVMDVAEWHCCERYNPRARSA